MTQTRTHCSNPFWAKSRTWFHYQEFNEAWSKFWFHEVVLPIEKAISYGQLELLMTPEPMYTYAAEYLRDYVERCNAADAVFQENMRASKLFQMIDARDPFKARRAGRRAGKTRRALYCTGARDNGCRGSLRAISWPNIQNLRPHR